ncbi:hypothetical protein [Neobacillus fumarioli]|uniref:hypothetical protein n=1 Tax=Neobacillus fumarioli TaxID=105229 RepID=UPI0008358A45|nr:hypothetical protein [Neobacillus fumarioli]
MAKLLDAQISQNASYANSISIPVSTTPQLFAQLTASTFGATGTVRTEMTGTVTVQLPLIPFATSITVTIVRGTTLSDLIIYSVRQVLDLSVLGPQVLSFTASDFNVPITANNQVVYTAFVSASAIGTVRVGPESFNAAVYSD